jgi:zona occludens toxin
MSTGALLTIISGTPGAGKTTLAVSMVRKFIDVQPERPVYVMGIPDFALPHEPVPPVAEWIENRPHPDDPNITYPAFVFPDGALIVIDEAQNVFRARAQGSAVPPHVAAMERHRHKGLDFILITQHPTMIDSNIRRLCGKYLHLRSMWSGRELLEWNEVVDPNSVSDRARATRERYRLDKGAFGLFKSSSMHVKQSRRIPKALYLFVVVVALVGFYAWRMFGNINDAVHGEGKYAKGEVASQVKDGASAVVPGMTGSRPITTVPAGSTVDDWTPRISTRPETAPMYDGIRQVKTLPVVAGCVAMADRCTCYTEQGTDAFLDGDQCREWLKHPPFNPWRQQEAREAQASPVLQAKSDVKEGQGGAI